MLAGAHMDIFRAAEELRNHARRSQTIAERIPVASIVVAAFVAVLSLAGVGMAAGAASVGWLISSIHFVPRNA